MIEQIAIGIFWTWGVFAVFQTKHLLAPVGKVIERVIGSKWIRPLFACPPCMGGLYGFLFSLYFQFSLLEAIIYIPCLIGANFIIKEHLYEDIQPED